MANASTPMAIGQVLKRREPSCLGTSLIGEEGSDDEESEAEEDARESEEDKEEVLEDDCFLSFGPMFT